MTEEQPNPTAKPAQSDDAEDAERLSEVYRDPAAGRRAVASNVPRCVGFGPGHC